MAKFFQYISWLPIYLLSKIFLDVNIEKKVDLAQLRGPLIIAANHISFYDSFLLRLVISGNHRLLPLRFMGVTTFDARWLRILNYTGVIALVYKIFGVFEVRLGAGLEKNLEIPRQILKEGGVVLVYPEGSINTTDTLMPFKKGVGALSSSTHVPVLPLVFVKKGTFRPRIEIRYRAPLSIAEGTSYEAATKIIEEKISELRDWKTSPPHGLVGNATIVQR